MNTTTTSIRADVHYRCGHIVSTHFTDAETAKMTRANARFSICKDCYLKNIGASEWIEEECYFDRRRAHEQSGHEGTMVVVDKMWGPEGCDNPTMFYRYVIR